MKNRYTGGGFRHLTAMAVAGSLNLAVMTGPAHAEPAAASAAATQGQSDALVEIIVTAERRVSDVQKTALSMSVREGADLQSQGRFLLGQILEDIPGVSGGAASNTGASFGSGTDNIGSGITIRGVPSNSGAGGSVTSVAASAAVYVDGVYEGVGGGYDIDRVEVLRGPQGTLYGRSATSGLVAIHTANPDLSRLGGNAAVEFGNYDLQHYTAAVNVPLVDDVLGIRVAGNRYEHNGYDSAVGGQVTTTDGKVKLLYKPNEQLSILLGAALQNNDTHTGGVTITQTAPNVYCFDNKTFCSPVPPGTPFSPGTPASPGGNDYRQYWAELNWDLGNATLTYQPAYRTWTSHALASARSTFLNFDQTIDTPHDTFQTHELRLASNPGSKLTWQVGAFYYNNNLSNSDLNKNYPSGMVLFDSVTREKATQTYSAFSEATYPVADSWRLTGGVRYDHTRVGVDQDYTSITGVTQSLNGEAGVRRFSNLTYKARLEHDVTAQNMLYASVTTGVSPGDVTASTGVTGNPVVLELKAETLTSYEIGSKNRFLNDTLQVNGAIYYAKYDGFQTAGVNITPQNPFAPTFATIASPVEVDGAELEVLYQFTSHDRVGVNLGYTNSYYVDKNGTEIYTDPVAGPITFGRFYARDKIPGVAPFTADVSYDHTVPLPGSSTLTLHGDARWHSPYDFGSITSLQLNPPGGGPSYFPYIRTESAWIGDLNATWASVGGKFSVTGYVRNVSNIRYKTPGPGLAGEPPGPVTSTVTLSDPRTYGVVLSTRF